MHLCVYADIEKLWKKNKERREIKESHISSYLKSRQIIDT